MKINNNKKLTRFFVITFVISLLFESVATPVLFASPTGSEAVVPVVQSAYSLPENDEQDQEIDELTRMAAAFLDGILFAGKMQAEVSKSFAGNNISIDLSDDSGAFAGRVFLKKSAEGAVLVFSDTDGKNFGKVTIDTVAANYKFFSPVGELLYIFDVSKINPETKTGTARLYASDSSFDYFIEINGETATYFRDNQLYVKMSTKTGRILETDPGLTLGPNNDLPSATDSHLKAFFDKASIADIDIVFKPGSPAGAFLAAFVRIGFNVSDAAKALLLALQKTILEALDLLVATLKSMAADMCKARIEHGEKCEWDPTNESCDCEESKSSGDSGSSEASGINKDCSQKEEESDSKVETGSEVDLESGAMLIEHRLAGYNSAFGGYSPLLVYKSNWAKPGYLIEDKVYLYNGNDKKLDCAADGSGFGDALCDALGDEIDSEMKVPDMYYWEVTIQDKTVGKWFTGGQEGTFSQSYFWDGANLSGELLPTGLYPYKTKTIYRYSDSEDIVYYGGGYAKLVNMTESQFGAGWSLADYMELHVYQDKGMIIDGSGSVTFIPQFGYVEGIGHSLVRADDADSRFKWTLLDGKIIYFKNIGSSPTPNDHVYVIDSIYEPQHPDFPDNPSFTFEYTGENTNYKLSGIKDKRSFYPGGNSAYTISVDIDIANNTFILPGNRVSSLNIQDGKLLSITNPDGQSVYFQYDGNLLTKKSYFSNSFSEDDENTDYFEYQYDEYGLVSNVFQPDRDLEFSYDRGVFSIDISKLPPTIGTEQSPANPVDSSYIQNISTRPTGPSIFIKDSSGKIVKEINKFGWETLTERTKFALVDTVTFPNGLKKLVTWENGQPLTRHYVSPSGETLLSETYSYYPEHRKIHTKEVGSLPMTEYFYDSNDMLQSVNWLNVTTTYTYHSIYHSLPETIRTQGGGTESTEVSMEYDGKGLLWKTNDGAGETTFSYYNNTNYIEQITDPNSGITSFDYDEMGRVVKTVRWKGTSQKVVSCIWYDQQGRLKHTDMPKYGDTCDEPYNLADGVTFDYDFLDRMTQKADPLGKTESYSYNTKGLLDTYTDRNGNVVNYGYDEFWRLKSIDGPGTEADISYKYHGAASNGLLKETQSADSIVRMEYDALDRVTGIDVIGIAPEKYRPKSMRIDTSYNLNGRVEYISVSSIPSDEQPSLPSLNLPYSYNNSTKLLEAVGDVSYTYDELKRISNKNVDNGMMSATYGYNGQGRLDTKITKTGAFELLNSTYTYDGNGNITSIDNSGIVGASHYTYQYDALDRLIAVSRNGVPKEGYTYDAAGNIFHNMPVTAQNSWQNGSSATVEYQPGTNRLKHDNRCTYANDDNGNTTRKTCRFRTDPATGAIINETNTIEEFRYNFDWRDRLTSVEYYRAQMTIDDWNSISENSKAIYLQHKVNYGYDAQNRRVWREKLDSSGSRIAFRRYTYLGDNVLYELNENGDFFAYNTGGTDEMLSVNIGGEEYYYHTNHLGSVVAITDAAGDVRNLYTYTDSWGSFDLSCHPFKGCIPNRYTYTAREWDADAQLYYYRARWYDKETKRFISEDLLSQNANYRYVENQPLKYSDPYGLQSMNPVVIANEKLRAASAAISAALTPDKKLDYESDIAEPVKDWGPALADAMQQSSHQGVSTLGTGLSAAQAPKHMCDEFFDCDEDPEYIENEEDFQDMLLEYVPQNAEVMQCEMSGPVIK